MNTRIIPKTIHYCWFGGPKPELVLRCIESWRKHCPDFVIKEWNEQNVDINAHEFTRRMYAEKHYAFVADLVRLLVLEREGGIYLDTDMLLVQPIDTLLFCEIFLGEEEDGIISAGALGTIPNHPYIRECLKYYDTHYDERVTIPRILTDVYNKYQYKDSIKVYASTAFYPFNQEHISLYKGQSLQSETFGVHLWNYSWGHPLNRYFKKIGVYSKGKKIAEALRIKKVLKKLLGFV